MSSYIASFTFYTLAIIGVLLLAYVVAKKTMISTGFSNKNNQSLEIEQSLNIAPRKTLHIIRSGNEKFLIAADAERTTFLTKLETSKIQNTEQIRIDKPHIQGQPQIQTKMKTKTSIMRSILENIDA